jgi:hypothetical protein
VYQEEEFPADVLILGTSDKKEHKCYVNVSGLTEENHLVVKYGFEDTCSIAGKEISPTEFQKMMDGVLKIEPPNSEFNTFEGKFKLTTFPASKDINIDNIAL